jgi:hypothetical protein
VSDHRLDTRVNREKKYIIKLFHISQDDLFGPAGSSRLARPRTPAGRRRRRNVGGHTAATAVRVVATAGVQDEPGRGFLAATATTVPAAAATPAAAAAATTTTAAAAAAAATAATATATTAGG